MSLKGRGRQFGQLLCFPRREKGLVQVEEDITDQELLEIAKRRREDIDAYRRDLKPELVRDRLADTLDRIENRYTNRGKRTGKQKGSNKRDLPEKEYILITNKFTEAMARQYIRPNESKVLWFLIRTSWGWQKRSEFIPLKRFEKELDILKPHVSRALSSLVKRGIVTKLGNKRYAIQSDTSLWRDKLRKTRGKLPKK